MKGKHKDSQRRSRIRQAKQVARRHVTIAELMNVKRKVLERGDDVIKWMTGDLFMFQCDMNRKVMVDDAGEPKTSCLVFYRKIPSHTSECFPRYSLISETEMLKTIYKRGWWVSRNIRR